MFQNFFFEELMPFIQNWLPASTAPEDNYLAGNSMGCAATWQYGLQHPERFGCIAPLSNQPLDYRYLEEYRQMRCCDFRGCVSRGEMTVPAAYGAVGEGIHVKEINSICKYETIGDFLDSQENTMQRFEEAAAAGRLPNTWVPCGHDPRDSKLMKFHAYCMMPDGSGFIATYLKFPESLDVKKLFWYLNWLNFHPKSQPEGTGNLRYKIWNPADHWDHYCVNWTDKSEGVHTTESLDMGEGDRQYDTIRHSFNLREYGLTQARIDALKSSGLNVNESSDWESFDFEGAHLTLGQIRPCPGGGYERRSVEWIGWRPKDGKIVRVPKTPCDEAYLRKVAYHTLIEWVHLTEFIDDLYTEYHDKPIDAD